MLEEKRALIAEAFNEWMRRYTETPERFCSEWQSIKEYLTEQTDGKFPSYGDRSAAYLIQVLGELNPGL